MAVDTLLSTKLHIPEVRPNLVTRSRLLTRMTEGLRHGHRLTLISAPAGFGKTTLIREWAGAVERPVAWLSLDESDSDPDRFLRYIIAALSQAGVPLSPELLQASLPASPQQALVALINELAAARAGLLLVLDDYHLIGNYAVHDLVTFLLTNPPPGLHVVVGTREDPPLPLARMRARDQVTEIRENSLRFTSGEASAFLNQTMSLGLSEQSITSLASRTEGWITGLQLAGLALRQLAGGADEFVAAFAGDDRYIVDYLMAEVLDREAEPIRAFLRQTSVLDRLSAPLCDALTGRNDSQAILDRLVSANLFLVPLDHRGEWYRYHVLFAEVLRLTLPGPERNELLRKAAAWFAANGWTEYAEGYTRRAAEARASLNVAPRPAIATQPLVEPLSERELEVLRLIADGLSNAEIAAKLVIAQGTVKTHINNIYGKLEVQSRTQAVARSRELGLL